MDLRYDPCTSLAMIHTVCQSHRPLYMFPRLEKAHVFLRSDLRHLSRLQP